VGSSQSALDAVLGALESQPWPLQSRFTVRRDGPCAAFLCNRSGAQTIVRELDHGELEVIYEHALHAVTHKTVSQEAAVRLLLAILAREQLGSVEPLR
jgi:hypothetical protein